MAVRLVCSVLAAAGIAAAQDARAPGQAQADAAARQWEAVSRQDGNLAAMEQSLAKQRAAAERQASLSVPPWAERPGNIPEAPGSRLLADLTLRFGGSLAMALAACDAAARAEGVLDSPAAP